EGKQEFAARLRSGKNRTGNATMRPEKPPDSLPCRRGRVRVPQHPHEPQPALIRHPRDEGGKVEAAANGVPEVTADVDVKEPRAEAEGRPAAQDAALLEFPNNSDELGPSESRIDLRDELAVDELRLGMDRPPEAEPLEEGNAPQHRPPPGDSFGVRVVMAAQE